MKYCEECLKKQLEIDQLKQEIEFLKNKLNHQKRKSIEGHFGSSTPSSQIPLKENTKDKNPNKNGGSKPGRKGYGRRKLTEVSADRVETLSNELTLCPDCEIELEKNGYTDRSIIDTNNNLPEKVLYKSERKRCPRCKKTFQPRPKVFKRGVYGNNLLAQACVMHYYHGIPMGRIEALFGNVVSSGSLYQAFHRIAKILEKSEHFLIEEFRKSYVKHADETGWRTDGNSGYAWIFCSEDTTIFQFKNTRSASVAKALFGDKELKGVLVVDRYAGYNKIKCKIQYCYAHLLRLVVDLGKEVDSEEVKTFVSLLSYYLTEAMHLRNLKITDKKYYAMSKELKKKIIQIVETPAENFGIKNIQDIFLENEDRLYHWVDDRRIPAENNKAERELRPTVIARKVSFGSQSEQGAKTRSVIMTYLHTSAKRIINKPLEIWFKEVLDHITENPNINCHKLLINHNSS